MTVEARIKSVIFVVASLSIALGLVLAGGGCHRAHGPEVLTAGSGTREARTPQPSPDEAGKAKGAPSLAGPGPAPPATGGGTPAGPASPPLGTPQENARTATPH
jgi:hypothetical protein